jgi:hypothetical protein
MNRMAVRVLRWAAVVLASAPLVAQSVRVYSEFQRLDPAGNVLAVDQAPRPREILSPAVIRNAYASYWVAVTAPAGAGFYLFLGQNPDKSVKPAIYKVVYERRGTAWWPDRLEPLPVDEDGQVADPGALAAGQTARIYWLDLWVPAQTPVGRFRLEVQLNVGDEWVIYPLEMRALDPVLGAPALTASPLAPVDAPADATVREALRGYLCGAGKQDRDEGLTIRRLIRRNARQDVALARSLEAKCQRGVLTASLLKILAPGLEPEPWCQKPVFPAHQGAEWYLRVRDYLYRMADRDCVVDPAMKATITVRPLPQQP